MKRGELLKNWLAEEAQPFTGWDFAYLHGRMIEDQPPWSYHERAAYLMQLAESVVDLDTGGGERLLDLRAHWPRRVLATEGYPPNTLLAHERLSTLGGRVIMTGSSEDAPLPFATASFDLVLNRHGAFNPAELSRILSAKGVFLTKQVHGLWAHDLLAVFGAFPQWPDSTPEKYVPLLQAAGLDVMTVEDWQGGLRFRDVGAVVYYLKAVPWLVPGFSVRTHQDALFGLQQRLESGAELAFEARTYLIEARKPA